MPKKKLWIAGLAIVLVAGGGVFLRLGRRPITVNSTEQLQSLPYSNWSMIKEEDLGKSGVVRHDRTAVYPGVNLYNSRRRNEAYLMEMQGDILHTWSCDFGEEKGWQTTAVTPQGDLYFIVKQKMLGKLTWDSRLLWKAELPFHHWITMADNGDLFTLAYNPAMITYKGRQMPILDDAITILSPEGHIKKRISIYKLFRKWIRPQSLDMILLYVTIRKSKGFDNFDIRESTVYDLFHTNTIRIIRQDIPGVCRRGDLLVSMRNLDLIAIISTETGEVVWAWGQGEIENQHAPVITPQGHILVFDNGNRRGWSRILKIDPATNGILWTYEGVPREDFYSDWGGANQPLPNGNILITDSNSGRVFELTPGGNIAWDFFNPTVRGKERANIFRMLRIEQGYFQGLL